MQCFLSKYLSLRLMRKFHKIKIIFNQIEEISDISDEVEYRVYLLVDHKYPEFLRKVADEIYSSHDKKVLIFSKPYEGWIYSCKEDIRDLLKEDKTQEIKKLNIEVNYWKEAYEELKKKCLSFASVIEDAENHARWHKESAENQLKNEIREDN